MYNQPEDNKDIRDAKAYIHGDLKACSVEVLRLMIAVLDDRSEWILKTAEAADTLTDIVCEFNSRNESQNILKSTAAGLSRELYLMLGGKNHD